MFPANPFDPNNDAARLFDAIDGWGTDEDKIISVLCYRTASQRDVITTTYNNQHGVRMKLLYSNADNKFTMAFVVCPRIWPMIFSQT